MTQTITFIIWAVAIAVAIWSVIQKRNCVILLVMAVLVGVSVYWIIPPGVKTRLGLDLQGGLEVVYTAKTADGKAPTPAQLDQTVGILDRRVNGLGRHRVADPEAGQRPDLRRPARHQGRRAGARPSSARPPSSSSSRTTPQSRPVGPVATKEAALKELQAPGRLQGRDRAARAPRATPTTTRSSQSPADTVNDVPEAWYVYKRPPAMTGDGDQERARRLRPDRQAQRLHRLHRATAARSSRRSPASCTAPACSSRRRRRSPSCSTTSWSRTR